MTDHGGRTVITGDGQSIVLGALIKAGGAGGVYRLAGSTAQVAKIYHPGADLVLYERRIAAMLELRPQLPELQAGDEHVVQLAWPQALIYDEQKNFLGYLMPVVDIEATSELECVLQERQARKLGLPTGLGAKVTLAANLCAVIAELHRQRHYVVDLKPVNLRFYRHSLYMAMLDCDGFSIQGQGERFEAPQYTPDYLAPEFHARGLFGTGEVQQDRFALAVVVFQLLNFGIHPFTGRPQDESVPNDIPSRIAGRWYAHGTRPNTLLLPTPASGHEAMPGELRQLFDRAFESAGGTRPAADEWSEALRGYAQRAAGKLVVCDRDVTHQHFANLPCAACARVQLMAGTQAAAAKAARAAQLFPQQSYAPPPSPRSPRTSGPAPVPPNVVTASQHRTVPIAAAPGLPANWPAPAPPVPQGTVGILGAHVRIIDFVPAVAFALLFLLAFGRALYQEFVDGREEPTQLEVSAAAEDRRNAAPASTAIAVDLRTPTDVELEALEKNLVLLSQDMVTINAYAFERGLKVLRNGAAGRSEAWKLHAQRNPGPNGMVSVDPLAEYGSRARYKGFTALTNRDKAIASRDFARALWADPYDAEAWRGFALSQQHVSTQTGGLAIAMLHYPHVEAVAAKKAATIDTLVDTGAGVTRAQAENLFSSAMRYADRLLPRLRGSVPFAGQFRIDGLPASSWYESAAPDGSAAPVGEPEPGSAAAVVAEAAEEAETPPMTEREARKLLFEQSRERSRRIRAEEAAKRKAGQQ